MHHLSPNVWMIVIYDKGNIHCQMCHFVLLVIYKKSIGLGSQCVLEATFLLNLLCSNTILASFSRMINFRQKSIN